MSFLDFKKGDRRAIARRTEVTDLGKDATPTSTWASTRLKKGAEDLSCLCEGRSGKQQKSGKPSAAGLMEWL